MVSLQGYFLHVELRYWMMDTCVKFLFGRNVAPNFGYKITCLPCVMWNWSKSWRLPCGGWNPMWILVHATFQHFRD